MVPLTSETDAPTSGLRLGTAMDEDGSSRAVRVGVDDLLPHTQILAAPGTGKSTLLAALVSEAAVAGIGVTVLESHGPLVERIVRELPKWRSIARFWCAVAMWPTRSLERAEQH